MKKNPLLQAAELADLLNGIKDILQAVQSQFLEQNLRIIRCEEQLGISGADPVPERELGDSRRIARWKGEGFGEYSCSLCGEIVVGCSDNFCPSCGAFMDPVSDDEVL